ncbi:ribosome recycling factor [Dyadobacter sp. BE34]|jgi:ribosome recycling factor|uniref:Ribosome-recycling factor n=1 Tax=Dyadobacter fermentans TaxID=94254 RepID=A0ABU1R450_9BACT|nr:MULTISPECIES: ribosome recycling factor [Dyadobacter]HWV29291.1 ribosome recycling factor [Dyadobacter sp.]MBZ1357021.1 ribosome recycling factor [Dyadobacter fermentans]MDR6808155.1 ribosome recycling factor [Dyadobacter fermentans]MDR7046029.1 ribosome recycling factor [Dyadobacter sp. BE242]MDR7200342.1 ribosome recycling factor [Dyadobacter sp. BE34]
MEEIELYLDDAKDTMDGAIKHLIIELGKIRAGKASPQMLEGLQIEYYGSMTPIQNVATINTPDARTLAIKPFEKKIINDIEKAIRNSNLGFSPSNDGELIRISVPPLNEERRRELVKRAKNEIETAKINVRNIRQDANNSLRKLTKEGVSEDLVKSSEERVQKLTDSFVAKIEQIFSVKEKEIMEV